MCRDTRFGRGYGSSIVAVCILNVVSLALKKDGSIVKFAIICLQKDSRVGSKEKEEEKKTKINNDKVA